MFSIRQKLVSLLRPWLVSEPDLDLKLGLLRSHGTATNLLLDTTLLNPLIQHSTCLSFEQARVQTLSLAISPCSFSAITVEVTGVYVKLSVRNNSVDNVRYRSHTDWLEDQKKEILSVIDPEGSVLHAVIEEIAAASPSRNRIVTSLLNVMLRHSRLLIRDLHVELQWGVTDHVVETLLTVKELRLEALHLEHTCLLKGLVGAIFVPLRVCSLALNASTLEIGLKRDEQDNRLLFLHSFSNRIKLKNLRLLDLDVCVSQLNVAFTPMDIPIIQAFEMLTFKQVKSARNGRELWNIARSRMDSLTSNPKLALRKLVGVIRLWLLYVHSYESLLTLLGYPMEAVFEKSSTRMSSNQKLDANVKNQWKVVSKIEKELSVEILARARQVARERAAVGYQQIENCTQPPLEATGRSFLLKIFWILKRTICFIFQLVLNFFNGVISNWYPEIGETSIVVSENSYSHCCFSLRQVLIMVYPSSSIRSTIDGTSESPIDISHLNLLLFSVTLDAFFLTYTASNIAQSLYVSCGDFKAESSLIGSSMGRKLMTGSDHFRRKSNELIDSKVILSGEPAPKFPHSDGVANSGNFTGNGCFLHLKSCLDELWLNWNKVYKQLEDSNAQTFKSPFLLCEIKSSLMDQDIVRPGHGIWKCNMSVGKLNAELEYSTIVSLALLQRQIEHTLNWARNHGRSAVLSQSPSIKKPVEVKWEYFQKSYSIGMKTAMLSLIPEKKIQIAIVTIGPKIRMSLQEGLHGAKIKEVKRNATRPQGDFCIAFNLQNIELSVWPASESTLAAFSVELEVDDGLENGRSMESNFRNIRGKGSDDKFICKGHTGLDFSLMVNCLTVHLEDLEENKQYQLIGLNSAFIHSLSSRKYTYSFTTNHIALSASLSGITTGAIAFSYMDELEVFLQVVNAVLSELSDASLNPMLMSIVYPLEVIWKTEAPCGNYSDELIKSSGIGKLLVLERTQFVVDASFEFGSIDIIINGSRKIHMMDNYMKAYAASGKNMRSQCDLSDHGIAVSVQKSHAQILCEEGFAKTCIDLSRVLFFVFGSQSQSGEYHSIYELRNLIHHSSGCLYVSSLSDLSFTLCAKCHNADNTESSVCCDSIAMGDQSLETCSEEFDIQSCDANPTIRLVTSNHLHPASAHQILINIALGEIVVAEDSLKNVLIRAHQQKKLLSSLTVVGELHTISWAIQGGLIILETAALAMFLRCFSAYRMWIQNAFSILGSAEYVSSQSPSDSIRHNKKMVGQIKSSKELELISSTSNSGTNDTQYRSKSQRLEALSLSLSQFSLILAISDTSGGVWEFILETDFQLNVELTNLRPRLLFDLCRLSILSQRLLECCPENMTEFRTLHFPPLADNELSSRILSGDVSRGFQPTESIPQGYSDACSSSFPVSQKEYMVENDVSGHTYFIHENCILKHATASILVEKAVPRQIVGRLSLNIDWIGGGSVSGLDVTVSLSETQMILFLIESLSVDLSEEVAGNSKERYQTWDQGQDNVSEDAIPDGAVVAIQDLQQQTYFAVEGVENQYRVIGTIHYSLVGERALFKVMHCKKRSWGSVVSWISLISLHAKSGSGEPLRLNYRSGSVFVDLTSESDNCGSLWRTIFFRPENCEVDSDSVSSNQASKSTFFIVNKKCDLGVAFIDGVPEFVKKPGNPFKIKLFPDVSVTQNIFRPDTHIEGSYIPDEQNHTHEAEGGNYDPDLRHHTNENKDLTFGEAINLPYINITINKVALTFVHELPDSNYKFPLLRFCIDNARIIVQVLCSKARLISTFTTAILYYDAQENLWREIVHPVEMCLFYRSRFVFRSSEIVSKKVPVHFFFRIKQIDVYLTELSLDILLFMAGELRMAGPFTVRSSAIFANCCKVENQSSISLSCHFNDNQDATIAGKRSASVFIRYGALANHPQNPPFLTFHLAAPGGLTTSPVHVSLISSQVFAWRTHVIHGSRHSPGPFVVVDVSKKPEDGLSVVVSPLLRIHNETGLSMEMRFWRLQEEDAESASVLLKNGDTIDDSVAALDAMNLFGGSKKVLMSLPLGNFLFSCRPVTAESSGILREPISADWSEDLRGGKAVCLSGIFDKLTYQFRRVLGVESVKVSFSTVHCSLSTEGSHISDLHFLIQTIGKDVPVAHTDDFKDSHEGRTLPVTLQEQREIFLLPTVKVLNHLQSEIQVLLTETNPDLHATVGCSTIGKQATICCGESASFYADPAMIYFSVMLTEFNSSCKPVNSGDWVKKLRKKKNDATSLDINLDFCSGKYFASLRLSRGDRGILEAVIFTSYVLQNNSDLALVCFASEWKHLSRMEVDEFGLSLPPHVGTFLPPKSTKSWFLKSNRINLRLLEERASNALLDLDVVSGFTEVSLETLVADGVGHISKLGVSLKPLQTKMPVSSQIVLIVPRYVISNETEQNIFVRQCYLEEDLDATIAVDSKQKATFHIKTATSTSREFSLFDSLFRKHKHVNEDYLIYIQFRLNDIGWSWSGPICVCSLGRFFLKFRRQLDSVGNQSSPSSNPASTLTEFAVVHVEEEGSSLVLKFDRTPKFRPPYRIENLLPNASVTYYQKDSVDPEILASGSSVDYVWDDLSLPHRLIVQITDMIPSREINMDKVCVWKPLFKVRQQRGLGLELPLDKKPRDQRKTKDESLGLEMLKVGYEVYADGSTRILRISEYPGRGKEDAIFQLCAKIQFRVTRLVIHLLENKKQEENVNEPSVYSPVVIARLGNINLDSMFTDQNNFNKIRIQSVDVDEKWPGAPFAAMFRRNELDYSDMNESILQIVFILLSNDSGVKKVKYASTILQPLQLNIDEETLMKFVPFWRTSLSNSNTPSQQFYFEHFEIHPIKIVASFLPGSSNSTYSSSQETLRSFLHSIVKIPSVTRKNAELNGILLTHALVTVRELFFKCAKHYSWYAMRAVYIAKGSPLLPPAFASIFDDSASSSLDIFFDPSSGLVNLPGMTLGMFKFISKCIDRNGFSGTKRYFGDLGKSVKTAGSNVLFTAVTEISDSVLKGAEANGFNGMVNGFNQGILKLAMEPSVLGTAVMEGGPDRKIILDRSPGVDELYIEGYLQAMLDTIYKQEYLRVRVIDNQVILKNLPPSSSLINEIMDRVRSFLISRTLLQGDSLSTSRSLRHLRGEREWKFGPTMLTLWEHLFVSFAIRMLRKHAVKLISNIKVRKNSGDDSGKIIVPAKKRGIKVNLKWGARKFVFSAVVAYLDGRLCRCIPNAIVRRIVSGFLLSLLDDSKSD